MSADKAEKAMRYLDDLSENKDLIVEHMLTSLGGIEIFMRDAEERLAVFNALWVRDEKTIGDVLHAHLVVEHCLTQHLQVFYPEMPDLNTLGLKFVQKVKLISAKDHLGQFVREGLIALNKIRNNLAHKMHLEINPLDVRVMRDIPYYKAFRKAGGYTIPEGDLEALLDFSMFAAATLNSSTSTQFREAFNKAADKILDKND